MPRVVDRQRVQELVGAGAQLIEVLPESDYAEVHLPGAINIPLKKLSARTSASLDPRRPVICYCFDYQ